jgi:SAM-dependent methyltransferase
MASLTFLARVLLSRLVMQDRNCPHCGCESTRLVLTKRALLELRQCERCGIGFRWPKDSTQTSFDFYQRRYRQAGLTTDLPDLATLAALRASNFKGTEKDLAPKIEILRALTTSGTVLDFGCSWGYGTYQLRVAGYQPLGYEISRPRAEFGRRHLAIRIIDDPASLETLSGAVDVIFSSHVLEHLPTLRGVFGLFRRLLTDDGLAMIFVPNCRGSSARELGAQWGPLLCEKHGLALDADFLLREFARNGFRAWAFSDPYHPDEIGRAFLRGAPPPVALDGDELLIVAHRNGVKP